MKDRANFKWVLNNFESYVGALLFIFVCALMFTQVISRYFFNHAITWAEELATLLFVPMVYCGYASAVTNRKHISVEAIQYFVPFKVRKIMKIASDVVFLFFCIYMQFPLSRVISNLGNSTTDLLQFRKKYIYITIPILLILVAIRLVQDILKLIKEDESTLGKTKPTIDLEACEEEYKDRQRAKAGMISKITSETEEKH